MRQVRVPSLAVRDRGRQVLGWAARWGFAVLIGLGAAVAVGVGGTVDPPPDVPSFALQASPVYRLEVGAAVFAAAYVASLAFVLALDNRGFSELSTTGVKARDLHGETQDEAIKRHDEILDALTASVSELRATERPGASRLESSDDD